MTTWSTSTVRSADGTTIMVRSAGSGPAVMVVGGALRTSVDYLPFAECLTYSFEVHVVDRRGRGGSGPQGADYSLDREIEDLLAVRDHTGASFVFGHSYGGLVALHTAARADVFTRVAVYEPGVSVNGSIPFRWTARYEELLAANDRRGAFAHFVRESGGAPRMVRLLPRWYLKFVLRVVIGREKWAQMEPLLETSLAEHHEVARVDNDHDVFRTVRAHVLLIGGSRSPAFMTRVASPDERSAVAARRVRQHVRCARGDRPRQRDDRTPPGRRTPRVLRELTSGRPCAGRGRWHTVAV